MGAAAAECLHCGRPFERRKLVHIFCSPDCRHGGERRPEERRWSDPERYAQLFGDDRLADVVFAAFKALAADASGGDIALVAKALRASGDPEVYELFGIGPEPIPDAPFERDRAEAVEEVAEAADAGPFVAPGPVHGDGSARLVSFPGARGLSAGAPFLRGVGGVWSRFTQIPGGIHG